MEFHISRTLRDRLELDETLFRYTGDVVFGNVGASRTLAQRLSEMRAAAGRADSVVNAGALFAMGLIDELNHAMVAKYRKDTDPAVLRDALRWFGKKLGEVQVDRLLLAFCKEFPSLAVYRGEQTAAEWLAGSSDGLPNREAAFEELMMLWLANSNPAFEVYGELFADASLKQGTAYGSVTADLGEYFETRPPVSVEVGTLLDALRAPALASPDSLTGQLDFMREKWTAQLGIELKRVLLAVDVLREEDVAIWMRFHPAAPDRYLHGAPGRGNEGFVGDEYVGFQGEFDGHDEEGGYWIAADGTRRRDKRYAADYQAPLNEYEAFSADQAWMPNVVMMAKSTYVWLEQLSQKYGRHIHRLDQIPDEELALLAGRGMTALWLIGLWERSTASQTIKRLRGHADAVASAYSLKEYRIAEDLGGNEGYEGLRDRAGRYGIRLASDMVPNHMGIDSNWVIEHPEWFLTRAESPFPSYTFEGPDLSSDSRVEIKLEDHYYDQTDAAVAFRLRHHRDGSTRFMYHGNDGTTFAWNDTAQLDYSKEAVREHVIQTILYVARLFPIIRFDAAMVLAKRHVQRLWFPLPGAGGAIPSRAEDAMSQDEFEALMPHEFWREVVDRVAVEVPGTLLLAEAFWLLEGYFVRTLGMHRVYNSAFMNMLRDEENAKYRSYLKKTVEFDPDILKRYVNFMSNPDERTAIDQFGSGDKFFGCCTLLATLPGLPMFGHGQVEGFTERYGMEYKQAKMREVPNEGLVARHQQEIAPLLKRRSQFAESENFLLYDFWTDGGTVDENVFAYSNRNGANRSVIVYNNTYGSTGGTLHRSAASVEKATGAMRERSLAEGLALENYPGAVLAYRDTVSGLEYLRRTRDVLDRGLSLPLRGYQYAVLLDWRELRSTAEQPWDRLCDALNGAGVYSVDEALTKLRLRPLLEALRQALGRSEIAAFTEVAEQHARATTTEPEGFGPSLEKESPELEVVGPGLQRKTDEALDPRLEGFVTKSLAFFDETHALLQAEDQAQLAGDARQRYEQTCERLAAASTGLLKLSRAFSAAWPDAVQHIVPGLHETDRPEVAWAPLLAWIVFESFPWEHNKAELFDGLHVRSALAEVFVSLGFEGESAWKAAAVVRVLLGAGSDGLARVKTPAFWADGDVRWVCQVSDAFGKTYVKREGFEAMVSWLALPALVDLAGGIGTSTLIEIEDQVGVLSAGIIAAGYDLGAWLEVGPESEDVSAKTLPAPAAKKSFSKPAASKPARTVSVKPVASIDATAEAHPVKLAAKPKGALGAKLAKEPKGALKALVVKEELAAAEVVKPGKKPAAEKKAAGIVPEAAVEKATKLEARKPDKKR